MAISLSLRTPTQDDVAEMISVHESAFGSSSMGKRCLPASDPRTKSDLTSWIETNISDITLACDANGKILGWVRWARLPQRLDRGPSTVFTPNMFPPIGDTELAVKYFQSNVDSMNNIMNDEVFLFLGMIAVKQDAQRKGVGSALMKLGVDKADEEGLSCYLNGTLDGKGLYEKFGFSVSHHTYHAPGIESSHMKRGTTNETK